MNCIRCFWGKITAENIQNRSDAIAIIQNSPRQQRDKLVVGPNAYAQPEMHPLVAGSYAKLVVGSQAPSSLCACTCGPRPENEYPRPSNTATSPGPGVAIFPSFSYRAESHTPLVTQLNFFGPWAKLAATNVEISAVSAKTPPVQKHGRTTPPPKLEGNPAARNAKNGRKTSRTFS